MKLVILGAGIGTETLNNDNSFPKCLTLIEEDKTVLDIIIENTKTVKIDDIIFIGGYNILDVLGKYPSLNYYYNSDWLDTGNLYSLGKILDEINDDLIIIYSDILFNKQLFHEITMDDSPVSIVYDSLWKERYSGRHSNYLNEAEKIFKDENRAVFSKENVNENILGEFCGVVKFSKDSNALMVDEIRKILEKNRKATILDLLNSPSFNESISIYDIKGKWAELDNIQDLNAFRFGTKAETLNNLRTHLKESIVLDQFSFTVADWISSQARVMDDIQDKFRDAESVVVRSSAINEDTFESSQAGNFDSVLDVNHKDRAVLCESVESVVESYRVKEDDDNSNNQVFVQPFMASVDNSGVIFTRDLETKAPYYIINYDDTSQKTDTVTSGSGSSLKTCIVNKDAEKTSEEWVDSLLKSVKEIEKVTSNDSLDIEFAIKDSRVVIFQVRPIVAHKNEKKVNDADFQKAVSGIKTYIRRKLYEDNLYLHGSRTAYGTMPDWNPAEIIGVSPKPLALSLYKHIITDHIWPESRSAIGYKDVDYNYGMFEFYGKPYIDLRVSFNSFTPDSLSPEISDKLIDFYIQKLIDNPHFHDKVEFDVVLTAYDFNLKVRFDELLDNGFTRDEVDEIEESLRLHTKKILESDHLKSLEDDMQILNDKRKKIVGSEFSTIEKIYFLTRDCKKFGTFQFSIIARYAFIANILLKSLVAKGVINKARMNDFFESLETIPKMLLKDKKSLDSDQLKEKYGHLRPGTYDIESFSYKENIQLLGTEASEDAVSENSSQFEWTSEEQQIIIKSLEDSGFDISFEKLMDFSKTAIEFREHSKFNFTNNLSLVLDLIVEFCGEYGISRADASYLSIEDILQYYGSTLSFNIKGELRDKIKYNKRFNFITKSLKLPDLIFSEDDVDFFMINESKPNYITEKKIVASLCYLDSSPQDRDSIKDKIVLIEKADPGYDWIFSCNISGLITKYGGVASHMAIRAAELGLPAAIGCGELIFNHAKDSNVIELDCNAQQIKRIN